MFNTFLRRSCQDNDILQEARNLGLDWITNRRYPWALAWEFGPKQSSKNVSTVSIYRPSNGALNTNTLSSLQQTVFPRISIADSSRSPFGQGLSSHTYTGRETPPPNPPPSTFFVKNNKTKIDHEIFWLKESQFINYWFWMRHFKHERGAVFDLIANTLNILPTSVVSKLEKKIKLTRNY